MKRLKKKNIDNNKKADKKSASNKKGQPNLEKFNFDNEIIIGVTKIEEPKKEKHKKKKNVGVGRAQPKKEKQVKSEYKKKKTKPNKKIDLEKERKKRRILAFLKGIAIVTLIMGGTLGIALSPLFEVEKLETEGNNKVASEEIINLSEIEIGENIFLVRNNTAINKILKNPYIEEVKINKQLPDKIVIKIKERKPTFYIESEGKYIYINNQGYILEIKENKDELPQILFNSLKSTKLEPGARLAKENLETLGIILRIMEAANGNGIGNLITIIDIVNKNDIKLVMSSERKGNSFGKYNRY
ncbi:MAG: FtsQ-type POTRA domain-containing protein [Clostridia bacterium]|nr:FtsQ-type POTRA domain-containing protein [Clostridia bacterium]